MDLALTVDFGSTYTKAVAVDLARPAVVGQAKALTTVETDITEGLHAALAVLEREAGVRAADFSLRLACSSAAGGLRMVAVGLVPELTAAAAKLAALGAGARVSQVYAYEMSDRDVRELSSLPCDLILLAGGTDGGDKKTLLGNAAKLAAAGLKVPVIVAGNRVAADEAADILRRGGLEVRVTENVLPALRELRIEPARETIRRVFMERIVAGKGFRRAEAYFGRILMPTPAAVLRAAELLAAGSGGPGLGELMVVDVGGATTDVHSVAAGKPATPGTLVRGLPEPYAKRTVEGDLGLRVSAAALLGVVGADRLADYWPEAGTETPAAAVERLTKAVGVVPRTPAEAALDRAMARAAVETAVERHVGTVEPFVTPTGTFYAQTGKDLTSLRRVIGTGGIFAHTTAAATILRGAVADGTKPQLLLPRAPELLVDRDYLLWAAGLLATAAPDQAFAIMRRHLNKIA